ncbi:FAD/NAD(P)-binding domain-containing protein [Pleurostoma richardsiae]|uniref:FAD/NAD(P)-binding domain-containing protein n=1 Tax=Pleurostoma richardsiae TaxID=41990 RepID=A0AA38RT81_9PEZI|nr:FAD/NAD(P)-binding domain-containing protein [Pleurostoma richardsiae]
MAQDKSFKVVIAGGSVAGLTLANMLQLTNIDYVILEAYPHIAPQVGASIGLLPHGNRILDQLGLFDKIKALSPPIDSFTFRDRYGVPVAQQGGIYRSFMERHGFPIVFLDRQMVLQVLYENLRDKSKVLTEKRVTRVELSEKGATAFATDGSSYAGDIVIGADGIHSTVREEMWRLGDKLQPGWFAPSEAEAIPCDYSCIFGISNPCPGINPGALNSIFREKSSYLVNGGPAGRVYWFHFAKLPKRLHGSEIPRYSKADLDKALKERADDNILPDLKFSALIKNKVAATMTALPEYVYRRWHFNRIITIGDSAHKFHPIGGHGGNAAIESAATLVNLLVEALGRSSSGHLTTPEINAIFERVQEIRRDKTVTVNKYSHEQQRTESLDTPLRKIQALYLLPLADGEDILYNFSSNIPASQKLDIADVNRGERLIPYGDELLSSPKRRGPYQWLLIAIYVACGLLVHYGMWIRSQSYGLDSQFGEIITTGTFPDDPAFPLKRTYIGIPVIDTYLVFLAAAYMPGLCGWDKRFGTLQMYFLGHLIQPIAIWSIESCRKRNAMTLLALPTIWFTLVQWAGVGIYMPLYYAAYTWVSDVEPYWWPLNRFVPIHYAKSLLWANLIGYVLPTILMFLPWKAPFTIQNFEALWQPAPMFVPLLTTIFGAIYSWRYPLTLEGKLTPRAKDQPGDIAELRLIYVITGAMGVLLHWGVMFKLLSSTDPNLTLSSVFIPDFSATPKVLGEGIRNLFMADFWGYYVASYVWCASAVWDLKRVGRTDADVGKAAVAILAAHFVLGPGAVMSAVWYWREGALARTIFTKTKTQ